MENPIGERIHSIRRSRGMTLKFLAERTGLSTTALRRIETGLTSSPRVFHVQAIAEALGLTLGTLLPDDVMREKREAFL